MAMKKRSKIETQNGNITIEKIGNNLFEMIFDTNDIYVKASLDKAALVDIHTIIQSKIIGK